MADALVWEGADRSLLESVTHIQCFGQFLIRALIYRLVAESLSGDRHGDGAGGARDPYLPVVELALNAGA